MLILMLIYVVAYSLMGEDMAEKFLAGLGTLTALLALAAIGDPQWFLGVIVSPMYKHLKENYYDIWAETSQPDE